MTRLEDFAERLTLEILHAWSSGDSPAVAVQDARLVAECMVREFVARFTDSYGWTQKYLDEPEKP